jgi:hypothetical protein
MAWGAPHLTDGPSVRRQIVRATVGTLSVVAVVAVAALAYVYGAGPAVSVWWRVAGDSAVTLGEGVVLADVPPTTTAPVVSTRGWALDHDLAALAAPLGGGGRVVTLQSQLDALAPYYGIGPGIPAEVLEQPVAVLPGGVLRVDPAIDGWNGLVAFHGGPDAPVVATEEARSAFVLALVKAWGIGDLRGTGFEARVVPSMWSSSTPDDGSFSYGIEITGTACPDCVITSYDRVSFDAQGRLTSALIASARVTGSSPVVVPSAAQAFDDLRHHRSGGYVGEVTSPFVGAQLALGETGTPYSVPQWLFYDASGEPLGLLVVPPSS